MSVTVEAGLNGSAEWLSVTDAAMACRVSERTVRRWVSEGVVESRVVRQGQRENRLILRGSLPPESGDDTPLHAPSGSTDTPRQEVAALSDVPRQDTAGHVLEPPRISPDTHALSELATVTVRAEGLERELARADAERERLERELVFAQEQIEARANAEQQLRVMLLRLEETNRELAGALVQKALPPAPEVSTRVDRPRVRWWAPWRR